MNSFLNFENKLLSEIFENKGTFSESLVTQKSLFFIFVRNYRTISFIKKICLFLQNSLSNKAFSVT